MAYRITLILVSFLSLLSVVNGQEYFSYPSIFVNDNPSFYQKGLIINLPSVSHTYIGLGPSIGDFLRKTREDEIEFKPSAALSNARKTNTFYSKSRLESLGAYYGNDNWGLGLSHALVGIGALNYDEDLIKLLAQGNGAFIGEQLNIGPKVNTQLYHELAISANVSTNDFGFGVRVKYLSGILNLSTNPSELMLTTSDDIYQLTFENNFVINNAGVIEFDDIEDIRFNIDESSFKKIFSGNKGFAIDFGINYQLTPDWNLHFSVNDLGSIKWNENVTNYSNQGNYTFDGIDLQSYVSENTSISLADSLINILDFTESQNEFKTNLNYHFSLGAHHQFSPQLALGGAINLYQVLDQKDWTLEANAAYKIHPNLQLGTSYLYHRSDPFNLGFWTRIELGILQIYAGFSDLFGLFNIVDKNYTSVNLGMNLKF